MQLARRTKGLPARAGGRLGRPGAGGRIIGPFGAVELGGEGAQRVRGRAVEFIAVKRIELTCPVSMAPQLAALLLGAPWQGWPPDSERV
jgi:hypothetical protein